MNTWRPGRDAKAVRHPGLAGGLRPDRKAGNGTPPRVVVVGGGIAGLAAGTALAERGIAVTVLEREASLGGRVRAWPVAGAGTEPARTMSRGFHAFFRQYYNLRALLRRADPVLQRLTPVADYPLVLADGHRDSFAGIPRTPPLNLISFVAQSPSFTAADLARVDVSAALDLLDVNFPGTFAAWDGWSAADFLDRLRFPTAARHLALEVFSRSFFARPEEFSAGELVAMFHTYFLGSSEGLLFDVPTDDYDTALWAPLGRYLVGLGADVRTQTTVSAVDGSVPGRVRVALEDGEEIGADAVVLAADPRSTRRLVDRAAGFAEAPDWRERVAATRNAPPYAVWRLWLDRPVDAARAAFLGTSGFGPLDNVTVVERFEAGAARWATATGGSVVELHAYALPDAAGGMAADVSAEHARLQAAMRAELGRIYPETGPAQVVAQEWLVHEDCPLIGTTPWRLRPEVATADPRLVLAGDGVRCDYPVALMERAATTGTLAANRLLAGWGLAGHDLWTAPLRGRHPVVGRARRLLTR